MADLPAQLDWRRILPETAPPEPPDAELFLLAVAVELDRCWPEPADALRDRVRTHADLVVRAIFWWQSRRYDRLLDHVDFQPWTTRPERSAVDIVLRWLDREPADFHDLAGLDDLLRICKKHEKKMVREPGSARSGRCKKFVSSFRFLTYSLVDSSEL